MYEHFNFLVKLIGVEIWLVMSAFGLCLLFNLLAGKMDILSLLTDKRTGGISPSRIQSLILTFAAVGVLLSDFPNLTGGAPDVVAAAFGGSQLLYLYAKTRSYQK